MKYANATPAAPVDYYRMVDDLLAPEDVHDEHTVSEATATTGLFLVMAVVLTLVHGFNLYLFVHSTVWPIVPLLIHLVVSFVVVVITYTQYKQGMDVHHLAIMAIVSSVAGIFGAVGALVGYFSTLVFRARSKHFDDWYESIFPTDHPSEPEVIFDQILEGIDENPSSYAVMPFVEVMHLGSDNQKRRALGKMTTRFSPRFASAFRLALADRSNSIRVQAATAVAKIERGFTNKLERIQAAQKRKPNDAMLTLALAKFYDDYAFTGILDPELEKLNRQRAIATYQAYLQTDSSSPEALAAIGRLLFRNKDWQEAAEWFRRAMDRGVKSESILLWYFESLFRLGKFRELRQAMLQYGRAVMNKETLPADVRAAVSFWLEVA